MKKSRIKIFNCFVILLATMFVFTACSLGITLSLRAPEIFHDEANKTISWYQNEKAKRFDVYINNEIVESIKQEDNINVYTYNYAEDIVEDGSYAIKVKAIGDGKDYTDSKFSQSIIVYVGDNVTGGYDTSGLSIVRNSDYAPKNIEYVIEGDNLRWDTANKEDESVEKYVIQIYCNEYTDESDNSDKIRSFYVEQNYFNLTEQKKGNEVLAISVGSKYSGDENIYVANVFYHNPLNISGYNNIYVFDGGVYDFYIEDYEELQNLYYYSYITRNTSLTFMVEQSFHDQHVNDYFNMNLYSYSYDGKIYNPYVHQRYIMGLQDSYQYWSYYETYDFTSVPYLIKSSQINENGQVFTLSTGYSNPNPILNVKDDKYVGLSDKILTQVSLETPYYEKVDYTPRAEDYDNFVSDKNVLTAYCKSSEELYWAVENNVTPLFTNKTSRAYLVYAEAKKVLNEIISDQMSDYEKVLSIFDWIATNTCYDNDAYSNDASTDNTCYYLEGVFLDSNRVAVCDGFSKAFSLLCNMEGIDAIRVMGQAGGGLTTGGHAWNKVVVDGAWYVVDLTWTELKQSEVKTDTEGNIEYTVGVSQYGYYKKPIINQIEEYNCHAYFLVSDECINSTHTPFAQREKISDESLPAYKMYGFYTSNAFKYKGANYSRVVDSNSDMTAVLNYIYQNNVKAFEVLLDTSYVNSFSSISSILQNGRGDNNLFMGVSIKGALIYTGSTLKSIDEEKIKVGDKTYTCEYEVDALQGYTSVVYYKNGYLTKSGYVLFLTCESNILSVPPDDVEGDNRYTQFINYIVDNAMDYKGSIAFEDAILKDILNLDLDIATVEEIEEAVKAFLQNGFNTKAGANVYLIDSCTFVMTEDVSSSVYDGSGFVDKDYTSYVFDISITLTE